MARPPLRLAPLLLAVALGGCGPRSSEPRLPATTAAVEPREATRRTARTDPGDSPLRPMDQAPADARATGRAATAPAGAWRLQESDPPRAIWGVPARDGMLTLGCDHGARQLVVERPAIGVPDGVRVVTLDADGVRMDYPAERRGDARAPVLVTRVALDAPILDRLLVARRLGFAAGTDTIVATAPGASLQAVVDACRRGAGE